MARFGFFCRLRVLQFCRWPHAGKSGGNALESTEKTTGNRAPVDQPTTVHEIAERLFPAYRVDGGSVHLAGCTLEDRLFVRVGSRHGDGVAEFYLDDQGNRLEAATIEALGLADTIKLEKPPEEARDQISHLVQRAGQLVRQPSSETQPEHVEVAAVWCKFASGKLRFTIGDSSADLAFAGWARTLQPPAFVCPATSKSSFHLAATDDGRLTADESIETCAETGFRALCCDLSTCSVTGRRVVADRIEVCPVTSHLVLDTEFVECSMCGQRVSPAAVQRGRCAACRQLRSVGEADPRMARVLDEHPALDRWGHWKISETANVYILLAAGWFRRLLVVVDKESLELRSLATGNRFVRIWNAVDSSRYDFELQT